MAKVKHTVPKEAKNKTKREKHINKPSVESGVTKMKKTCKDSPSKRPSKVNTKIRKKTNVIVSPYASYISKICKNVHADKRMSKLSMGYVSSVIDHLIIKLINRGNAIAQIAAKQTLTSQHLEAATRLAIPLQLGDYAVDRAHKAVQKYKDSKRDSCPVSA
jgi:histone H2B